MAADNTRDPTSGSTTAEVAPDIDGTSGGEADDDAAGDAEGAAAERLSLDVIFEILRNRRRQLVLEFLRERGETVTIGELAEHIAAIENDTTVRQLNAQQRKRVYIGLYQCHLPKMDDVDVVDFNQSRGRITPGEHIEPLYEYLDVANGEHDGEEETTEPPFERKHGAGFLAFTTAFFVAQLAGAYMLASACIALLLVGAAAVTNRSY